MKIKLLMACFIISFVALVSCDDDISSPSEVVAYQNSFESAEDTVNWKNRENLSILPGGTHGTYSLLIKSNAEQQPATEFHFESTIDNDKFKFAVAAKLQDSLTNAYLKLEPVPGDTAETTQIEIKGSGWAPYVSKETFYVPNSRKFRVTVYTDSTETAGVQIDELLMIRVK